MSSTQSEDNINQSLLSAVLDAEDIDIMNDPSLHHLDLQIDIPFDNYDSTKTFLKSSNGDYLGRRAAPRQQSPRQN
ncbi:hypothetical protein RRG08_062854 [Elysia crispata]|uniref:Uncharacterized protein n=1 Tax=Elysia crispata TaxID=231223 RepID=A0AAE0ZVE4_9GAST|nr:hypothetical protein RRG08_062854 [Elysia crispata]